MGRELKEALSESPLAAANFVLLDEEEAQGQLDQVGDEVTFVQAIAADAFEHVDFTFFCGTEELTRKHWQQALRAGSTVLDLSGALDQETGVLVRAPWLGAEARGSGPVYTGGGSGAPGGAGAGAAAGAAAAGGAGAVCRGDGAAAGERIWPRRHGRAAPADGEPAQLSDLPRAMYDAQAAYNLLCGLGESATVNLVSAGGADPAPLSSRCGRALAGAGAAGDSRAGLSRARVFDCRGTGAAGGDCWRSKRR